VERPRRLTAKEKKELDAVMHQLTYAINEAMMFAVYNSKTLDMEELADFLRDARHTVLLNAVTPRAGLN